MGREIVMIEKEHGYSRSEEISKCTTGFEDDKRIMAEFAIRQSMKKEIGN
ncbi:MAG: hypothetical protein WAM14_22780 [Candidatus Nitrosopolaris sp.]